MSDNDRTVYARAIDVIDERGWSQGRDVSGLCLVEAVWVAARSDEERRDALDALGRATRPSTRRLSFLHGWNDAPGRTKEDVLTLLKFADADELTTWSELYGPGSEES